MENHQKRIFELEQKHHDLTSEYLSRISKYSITIITGLIAVLGFLLNIHAIKLIQHSQFISICLYTTFVALTVASLSELFGVQLYARYTASFRAYEQARKNNDLELIERFYKRQLRRDKEVDITRTITQLFWIVGLLGFFGFCIKLLGRILSYQ